MRYLSDAGTIARYIIDRCYQSGHPVSNLQLNKMLYVLQLTYCRATRGREMLFAETFQAWPYGPIIPSVYEAYRDYGGWAIERSYSVDLELDADTRQFIDDGIDVLCRKFPWDFACLSMYEGSPWKRVYKNGEGNRDEIANSLVVEAACA